MHWIITLTLLVAVLAPAGCSWLTTGKPQASDDRPTADLRPDRRAIRGPGAPALDYRIYRPPEPDRAEPAKAQRPRTAATWIILAHGFLRSQDRMSGLATALAGTGIPVATLNFRNDSPLSGGHVKNSRDMVQLATQLQADKVIYAGFSAGGLAALLAARNDPRTLGVLTLDLVDSKGLGERAAKGLEVPMFALVGAPSNCNANGNAAAVYAQASQVELTAFPQASHCDFETPTNWLCSLLCEDPDGTREPSQRARILQQAVADVALLGKR